MLETLSLFQVVFFTALFYLLSSSGSLYRPVELVASFSPSSGNQYVKLTLFNFFS